MSVASLQQYGPGHAIAAVLNARSHSGELLSLGPGLALSVAYAAVFCFLGAAAEKGSDVT